MEEAVLRQQEEIESLKAIYGDEIIQVLELEEQGCSKVEVHLAEDDRDAIRFYVFLNPSYPGPEEMPIFEIKGLNWMKYDQDVIYQGLKEIHEQQAGEVCLFQWIEWLREHIIIPPAGTTNEQEDEETGYLIEQQEQADEVQAEALQVAEALYDVSDLETFQGEPYTDRKSTFQAFCAKISTEGEAMRFLAWLKTDRKIARATHNIWAYRVFDVQREAQINDNDDDGEAAAGRKLADLLAIMAVNNVMVVVSRWYGGIQLGPDRFRIINNVARELLERSGFERNGWGAGGGKGGKGKGGGKR